MSGFFEGEAPQQPAPQRRTPSGSSQRSRALIGTAVVLIVTLFLVSVFTGVYTDRLWFGSIHYTSVFTTILGTKVLLFTGFGVLMALTVGANLFLAYRFRPLFRPASVEQANLDRYREVIDPVRRWLLIGICLVIGLFAGGSGAGQWRQYLLWRHRQSFGTSDPYFHKDVGFYVFTLPWWHYVVDFAMAAAALSFIAVTAVHYLFGGIRLQAKHDKFSGAAQVHLSVVLGVFVLAKAVDYYLDRYDLTTDSGRLFTGMGYTDYHAVLPSKNILMFISLICALLLFANVFRRTWLLPGVGLALLALSAILLGLVWPGIVQQFRVHPSEPDKEGPFIANNIKATRAAFGIADAKVTTYNAKLKVSSTELRDDAASLPGIRLLDPAVVSETFEQLQQVRGYYSVPRVLDVDRYDIEGRERDMVLAVRELNQAGLQTSQRNWANLHTVYTHGYGVIAAYGNQRNAADQPVTSEDPAWAERYLPPRGVLSDLKPGPYQPRIYYGENSPDYSIVGRLPGHPDVELDVPANDNSTAKTNTYGGSTGVPVGSLFNQLAYAIKFGQPNIVLSSRVNADSRILYDRAPRTRVQKVAPWLTVDGDAYPAVVDGRIKWILDGYTTTDRYPNSQKNSLSDMTTDSLQGRTTYATLPTDQINYMRNSVKAVVDAYDGTVTLYAWDDDPMLRAWSAAFPGTITPRKDIPPDLLAHMRYPEDLFKVQRSMLTTYHVTDARTFYEASDRWKVPEDPADERQGKTQAPYRVSVQDPGTKQPVFSLTSVYLPFNRQNLAAYISVDGDPTQPGYGTIRILRLPGSKTVPGPSQISNLFQTDDGVTSALLPFTRNKARVIQGNLLTLPVGGGLLYVQPIYTERQQGVGTYPVLRYVVASFGTKVGIGTTLTEALDDVLGVTGPAGGAGGGSGGGSGGSGGGSGPVVSGTVRQLLREADAEFDKANRALSHQNLGAYARHNAKAQALVRQALRVADREKRAAASKPKKGSG